VNPAAVVDWTVALPDASPWPPDVTNFLALVDEVRHAPEVPTVGSLLEDGRLTLLLGKLWERAPHAARVEILRHEASHVAHGCWARHGDRNVVLTDPSGQNPVLAWNIATDANIHGLKESDWEVVDRECDWESVTYERLSKSLKRPLTLMPSERLYDIIVKEAKPFQGHTCGAAGHSLADSTLASRMKASAVGRAVLGDAGPNGNGMRPTPTLPACPPWIQEVLDWLVTRVVAREERLRSWRRAHRVNPDLLPGSARGEARAARFMLDASGSIGDELLGQLLAAVCSTPELASSDVVVFDHLCREPVDASDVGAVLAMCRSAGGGTLIRAAGEHRDPDKQTVWLTDGGTADGWPVGAEADLWVVGAGEPVPAGAQVVRRA